MPDREKVIKGLHDARRYLEDKEWSDRGASPHIDAINDALVLLKEQPKIVRCKDCKYYDHFNGCMSWHDVNSKNDNWYCADGERRDTDD